MRRCAIVPVQHSDPPGYKWQWRDATGSQRSARLFPAFHDCLADARNKGYAVILDRPVGDSAPGRYALNSDRNAV